MDEITQYYLVLLKEVFTSARLLPDCGELIATKNCPEIDVVQGEVLYTFGGFLTPSIGNDPLLTKAFWALSSISKPEAAKTEKRLTILQKNYESSIVNFAKDFSTKNSAKATCEELKRRFGVNVTVFKVREWRREARKNREVIL
jgi:hypothetical protein